MDKQECFSSGDGVAGNGRSEAVEDLVERGDVDGAVTLLETVISKLEATDGPSSQPSSLPAHRLASAKGGLGEFSSAAGLSSPADALRSRAFSLLSATVSPPPESKSESSSRIQEDEEEDDWEAVADRNEDIPLPKREADDHELSSSHSSEMATQRRRGRGTFMYNRNSLYSDQTSHEDDDDSNSLCDDPDDDRACNQISKLRYGTRHVLVLYDLSLSTRTADLEKVFESFRDTGVSIRWVNDTTALAVFRTPSLLLEARGTLQCPFKVRILSEEDDILSQISARDLEPPYPRPKTSARTAQRLIAQGMGIKLPTDFGLNELRKQEADRKNRIITRQNKRDDAWGSD